MKKLQIVILLVSTITLKSQTTELVYQSDTLQYTADKALEKKPCKITFTYVSDVLTQITLRYNEKKEDDWKFINLKKVNYYWNCEEYSCETPIKNMIIGVCGEGKTLDRKSFIICTPEGIDSNDCFKYLNLREVKK